jgi:hypothetical protein
VNDRALTREKWCLENKQWRREERMGINMHNSPYNTIHDKHVNPSKITTMAK